SDLGTGAWNYVTGALDNGSHSLTAIDTDVAGNTGAMSSSVDVSVDASITVTPTSYTSYLRGLGVVTGNSEANSSVSIYDGNTGAALGHTTAGSNGACSVFIGNTINSVHNFGFGTWNSGITISA